MIPYIAQPFSIKNPDWETIRARTTEPGDSEMLWNNGGVVTFSAGGGGGSVGILLQDGTGLLLQDGTGILLQNGA